MAWSRIEVKVNDKTEVKNKAKKFINKFQLILNLPLDFHNHHILNLTHDYFQNHRVLRAHVKWQSTLPLIYLMPLGATFVKQHVDVMTLIGVQDKDVEKMAKKNMCRCSWTTPLRPRAATAS